MVSDLDTTFSVLAARPSTLAKVVVVIAIKDHTHRPLSSSFWDYLVGF